MGREKIFYWRYEDRFPDHSKAQIVKRRRRIRRSLLQWQSCPKYHECRGNVNLQKRVRKPQLKLPSSNVPVQRSAFTVYLRGIYGVYPVDVMPSDTTAVLKQALVDNEGLQLPSEAKLYLKGNKLVEVLTLEDQLVTQSSNIYVCFPLKGGADKDTSGDIGQGDYAMASPNATLKQTVVNISQSEGVQIGNQNTIVINKFLRSQEVHDKLSEDDLIDLLCVLIEETDKKRMTLNELASTYDARISQQGGKKFKEHGYGPLKTFLQRHHKWFQLKEKKGLHILVKVTEHAKKERLHFRKTASNLPLEDPPLSEPRQVVDLTKPEHNLNDPEIECASVVEKNDNTSSENKTDEKIMIPSTKTDHERDQLPVRYYPSGARPKTTLQRSGFPAMGKKQDFCQRKDETHSINDQRSDQQYLGGNELEFSESSSSGSYELMKLQPVLQSTDNQPVAVERKSSQVLELKQEGQFCFAAETLNIESVNITQSSFKAQPMPYPDPSQFEIDSLSKLLCRCERDFLKFRSCHYRLSEASAFMKDIASFWNTPMFTKGYIVIGVIENSHPPHRLQGLQESDTINNEYYQQMFNHNLFNCRPNYMYKVIQHNKLRFGVIIVANSKDRIGPCYPKRLHEDKDAWACNHLFYRDAAKFAVANTPEVQKVIYDFFAEKVPHKHNPDSCSSDEVWEEFLGSVNEFEKGRAYTLILSKMPEGVKRLEALANLPVLKVFDFDSQSGETGALSHCKEVIRCQRGFYLADCHDTPKDLSIKSTEWFFPVGDSRSEHNFTSQRDWLHKVGGNIDYHCEKLAEFCHRRMPLTILVLWYNNDRFCYLYKLLEKLDEKLKGKFTFVLCMKEEPVDSQFEQMSDYLDMKKENMHIIPIDYVCLKLLEFYGESKNNQKAHKLPFYDEGKMLEIEIESKDVAWLREDLEVLYIDMHLHSEVDDEMLGREFFRGGTISWYEIEVSGFDAERDVYSKLKKGIQDKLIKYKSGIVHLLHAPSAGGTTLARRLLWNIQKEHNVVCACVTTFGNETAHRLLWLHDKTHLPVFIVVENSKDLSSNVVHLLNTCAREMTLVILYVQRSTTQTSKTTNRGDRYWLSGEVSVIEALRLEQTFSKACQTQKKRSALKKLSYDVKNGKPHCVYEYGLTVHEYEFRGVWSYVQGYLDLKGDLLPWQRVIAYLSLVSYYGHNTLPGQFFATVLGVSDMHLVRLDDLPPGAKKFICQDAEDGDVWRINLHVVAKEILEQILCRLDHKREPGFCLSESARNHLAKFACDFINAAGTRRSENRSLSHDIMEAIKATFFYRYSNDMSHAFGFHKKKRNLAPLVADIPSDPPYTDRLTVLQLLVQCFPEDPDCLAHLGRFYANERQEFETAHQWLDKALEIRHNQVRKKHSNCPTDQTDVEEQQLEQIDFTLSRIYNMKGMAYSKQISSLFGGRLGYVKDIDDSEQICRILSEATQLAHLACEVYEKSRKYYKPGYQEEIKYVPEIELRLQTLEFVQKNTDGGYLSYIASENAEVFVEDSLVAVDNLIRECNDKVNNLTQHFYNCVDWYHVLFHDADVAIKNWSSTASIRGRLGKIAAYRMKQKQESGTSGFYFGCYFYKVDNLADIYEIIHLHECNLTDVLEKGVDYNIDNDIKEWLLLIRHRLIENVYSIEFVLQWVRHWYNQCKSPFSIYYLFVLTSVLAMGTKDQPGSRECFAESNRLRLLLQRNSKIVNKPKFCYEWIGSEQRKGIRYLVNRYELGDWDYESRFFKHPKKMSLLTMRSGTIKKCHKDVVGEIEMDVGRGLGGMKVFFVPKASGFFGRRHMNTRVEFFVGFSFDRACEAFHVMELKNYQCPKCPRRVEISLLGQTITQCPSCKAIVKPTAISLD